MRELRLKRGTDKLVFHWKTWRGIEPVTPIAQARGLWVLPPPSATLKKPMLIVRKSIQPAGNPWSWFEDFNAVLGPIAKP